MLSRQTTLLYDNFSTSIPDSYQANSSWYTPNGYVSHYISGGYLGVKMKANSWDGPSQGQFSAGNAFCWQRGRDLNMYARFKLTTFTSGSLNYNDCWIGFAGSAVAFSNTWFGIKSYWGTGFSFNAQSNIGGVNQQSVSFGVGADNSWHEVRIKCFGSSGNVTVQLDSGTPVTLNNANLTGNNLMPSYWFWSNDSSNERGLDVDEIKVWQNRDWSHT